MASRIDQQQTVTPYLDHPELSSRYFYPWANSFDGPFFIEGNGFRLGCRYLKLDDALPTVIHFHGNGETVADYLDGFDQRLTSLGVNLLLDEFRGYGMSSGEPGLTAMLDDVELIVKASGVPPEQLIFFGRSLGSLYAAHGAKLYPQAAGLIIESGLADPLERILVRIEPRQVGATMEQLQQATDELLNQQDKIQSFTGQVLIMHTRNDDLVSVSHAERLYNYRSPDFDSSKLTMLGVKSTCKDRWRQVLSEAERITAKHLLTLEPGISENQTNQMKRNSLQLVVPSALHNSYKTEQKAWLITLDNFINILRERQL